MMSSIFLVLIIFNMFLLLCFSFFSSLNVLFSVLKMISSIMLSSFIFMLDLPDLFSFIIFSLSSFWVWCISF